jgi:S-formylglutathione hydrolase FrmB
MIITIALVSRNYSQTDRSPATTFDVAFPSGSDAKPLTGRLLVILSRNSQFPRQFTIGIDVQAVQPGGIANIDGTALGTNFTSIRGIPQGDYSVHALLNVYTEAHRKDGHNIWVHMDQWEGQDMERSPGNLVSEVQQIHIDPSVGFSVKLALTRTLPSVNIPADTEWIKRVKIQSKLLSEFWGFPVYLGATVLLPKGYAENTGMQYPAVYVQTHFGLGSPFPFNVSTPPSRPPETPEQRQARLDAAPSAAENGAEFYQSWTSENFPRMIAVTFLHPTPYYDDSYAVNSVNNGPYADALLTELIPYLEAHFRLIPKPYARVLTGSSTGGWEALALQIQHPAYFNGAWAISPDPVDFSRNQLIDLYHDNNAFEVPGTNRERSISRTAQGEVTETVREMSQLEAVLGSNNRSGYQIAAWDAAYGPIGTDGYPRQVWDRLTGKIDKDVVAYWRDNGFDLNYDLKTEWNRIGSDLAGKIHVYCGDMDNYFLNLAVYAMEDTLKAVSNPPAAATFQYGRPLKPHGWQPFTNADMIRMMYERIQKTAK